jgi:hypothetical protein
MPYVPPSFCIADTRTTLGLGVGDGLGEVLDADVLAADEFTAGEAACPVTVFVVSGPELPDEHAAASSSAAASAAMIRVVRIVRRC